MAYRLLKCIDRHDNRNQQFLALNELCSILSTTSDSVREYNPPFFIPPIFKIFRDKNAPDNLVEVAARALTLYLKFMKVDGLDSDTVRGIPETICKRLMITDTSSRIKKELAEQCCKLLDEICSEMGCQAILEADGLNCVLLYVNQLGLSMHRDTLGVAMAVISTLCMAIKPEDKSLPSSVEHLSKFLRHDDSYISEEAFMCFVVLTNRFIHGGTDTAILAKHGLLDALILRLCTKAPELNTSVSTTVAKYSKSRILKFLTALCCGSKSLFHDLVRCNLPDAIEETLKHDERCCLETMHFVDLLLVYLIEGRDAVLWSKVACTNDMFPKSNHQNLDSAYYDNLLMTVFSHKNIRKFLDSVVASDVDERVTDTEGYTFLNLVCGLGTPEMVEYLCSNGADVNNGQYSSLLFALQIKSNDNAKVLLKYGPNLELRNKRGETPLDVALKREDFLGEIATILQSPESSNIQSSEPENPKGDPEMAEIYLKRLLPVLCHTFHSNTLISVRKTSLSLIEKMVRYIQPDWLDDICRSDDPNNLTTSLTEILTTVLENEKYYDDCALALQTIHNLLTKCQDKFLDKLARSGIVHKIQQLISPGSNYTRLVSEKVQNQAQEIDHKFFKGVLVQPNDGVKLMKIVSSINLTIGRQISCVENSCDKEHWTSDLFKVLSDLKVLLIEDEGNISAHELYSSGLVEVLLQLLKNSSPNVEDEFTGLQNNLGIDVFVKCFKERKSKSSRETCASVLVQKLLSALESTERLPVYLYKSPDDFQGLKILHKPIQFRLEKSERERTILDFTGRDFRTEPLTTIKQVEKYLLKQVTTTWYDHERFSNIIVKKLKTKYMLPIYFEHEHDFDKNGVLYWIGTNGKTSEVWVNPGQYNLVFVHSSNGYNLPFGDVNDILSRDSVATNCHTSDDSEAWFSVDLGLWVYPTHYTLRHARGHRDSALRNWLFQVSKNGTDWTTLRSHVNDTSLNEPGDTCTWSVKEEEDTGELQGWHHIKIQLTGENASGQSHILSLSGFEVYGIVTGVCEDLDKKPVKDSKTSLSKSQSNRMVTGEQQKKKFKGDLSQPSTSCSSLSANKPINDALNSVRGLVLDSDHEDKDEYNKEEEPNDVNTCQWDDDFVLKRELIGLPEFDPRSRSIIIVKQKFDLEVEAPPENEDSDIFTEDAVNDQLPLTRLTLTLKGPNLPGITNVEVKLEDSNWTIFHAIQKLALLADLGSYQKMSREILEPTYTITYRDSTNSAEPIANKRDCHGTAYPANEWDSDLPVFSTESQLWNTSCTVDQILQLLQQLYHLSVNPLISLLQPNLHDDVHKHSEGELMLSKIFNSTKITDKLVQQLKDPLVLGSNALPSWCDRLNHSYSFLFPLKIRQLYFNCTAFGPTRSIAWLQSIRKNIKRDHVISRLLHDHVRIPRGGDILAWGRQLMRAHADRQTVLEVEFMDVEGTGLGPTMEFYSLVSAELQRKDLCMWLCSDEMFEGHSHRLEDGSNSKPPGYYVRRLSGLYPAPLPQESPYCDKAVKHFWFLGMFLAKVLQDNHLIDFPLSLPFLKLLTHAKNNECERVLDDSDLFDIDVGLAVLIKGLKKLILLKDKILKDQSLSSSEKSQKIVDLRIQCGETGDVTDVTFEDLSLNMVYLPSSSCFPFKYINLVENGHLQDVDINNIEKYVESMTNLLLHSGIKRQMNALKDGFCRVFSIEKLNAFTSLELRSMLCGQQELNWTREDLLNYVEPKLGFNKKSPGFLRLVNVLVRMNCNDRKSFIQFITGFPSLPPGGLVNLYPRLTVVHKVNADAGSFPSVNTCLHYLTLPEYPDDQTLRERLLTAMIVT